MARLAPGFDERLRSIIDCPQVEFASRAHVTEAQLSRYVNPGGAHPRYRTIERLAAAPQNPVRAEWLAFERGPMRGSRVPMLDPLLGRSTAGHQVAEPPAGLARTIEVDIQGVRVTIIIEAAASGAATKPP